MEYERPNGSHATLIRRNRNREYERPNGSLVTISTVVYMMMKRWKRVMARTNVNSI